MRELNYLHRRLGDCPARPTVAALIRAGGINKVICGSRRPGSSYVPFFDESGLSSRPGGDRVSGPSGLSNETPENRFVLWIRLVF